VDTSFIRQQTCRGRPRRRLPTAPKYHRRDSRRQPRTTRLWARAREKQLALPERTSGRSTLVRRLVGRAPPSRRDPHHAKPNPREDRRSGRRLPASFTMAPTTPTPTPCRGADRGGSRRTRRRCRARRKRWSQALPRSACSRCLSEAAEPRTFLCPSSLAGATVQPRPSQRLGGSDPEQAGERVAVVEAVDRSGASLELVGSKHAAPEQGSKRVAPEQGLSGRPVKKPWVRSKM
jgi:hypothetical protein